MLPHQSLQNLIEAKRVFSDVKLRPSRSYQIDWRLKMESMLAKLLIPNQHTRDHSCIGAECDGREARSCACRNVEVVHEDSFVQSCILINQNPDSLIFS